MFSRVYFGKVRHTRFAPRFHEFTYGLYLFYLDLDELQTVFKGRWFWSANRFNFASFQDQDHLRSIRNGNQDLKPMLLEFLQQRGIPNVSSIRLLTQLRYLGFVMNPVSFYYCFDDQEQLQAIVAQVNNTPWNEEHLYLIDATGNPDAKTVNVDNLQKSFHVSPFMPMNMHYSMRYSRPGQKLSVRMTNFENNEKRLNVVMNLREEKITGLNLMRCLVAYPFISAKVFGAIYWEALRLYLKKIPFFSHPKKQHKQADCPTMPETKPTIR